MWWITIPAALLGLGLLIRSRQANLTQGAANKTNKPTVLWAPGFVAMLANLPQDAQVTIANPTLFASGSGNFVTVSVPTLAAIGLVNVNDITHV